VLPLLTTINRVAQQYRNSHNHVRRLPVRVQLQLYFYLLHFI
jgi:hypothetical protein